MYRTLMSSWGVWISITASFEVVDSREGSELDGGDVSSLNFAFTAATLPEDYKVALEAGWQSVLPDVMRTVGGQVELTVEEVCFVDTDFQPDGLPVAMIRWAEHAFDLDVRPVQVAFDRDANRYSFRW